MPTGAPTTTLANPAVLQAGDIPTYHYNATQNQMYPIAQIVVGVGVVIVGVVTFGHGGRHLRDTGLSQSAVEGAIARQIKAIAEQGGKITGGFWGRVKIGNQLVEYRAMPLEKGVINVGTYYLVGK